MSAGGSLVNHNRLDDAGAIPTPQWESLTPDSGPLTNEHQYRAEMGTLEYPNSGRIRPFCPHGKTRQLRHPDLLQLREGHP
jgi:hypothetical protein